MKVRLPLFHRLSFFTAIALVAAGVSCSRGSSQAPGPIAINFHHADGAASPAHVQVSGLSSDELSAVRERHLNESQWQALFTVTVGDTVSDGSLPPVQGRYAVSESAITFTPAFPFAAGHSYTFRFDPSHLPTPRPTPALTSVVRLPPVATEPSTVVTAVHPSADVVPENLLRMYVEFSAPMGNGVGLDFVRIIDRTDPKQEKTVDGAFLPVEANFWNRDHTRYTLFFDPGRVKEGIFPNRQFGRPLRAGHRYVLEVKTSWTDANGLPLKEAHRREFRVAPAVDEAINLSDWRIGSPKAGTSDPLVVTFPRPIDHAIITRALTVETMDGRRFGGTSEVRANDTQWSFTPAAPWQDAHYNLVAASFLEDPQGNQIGRAFEVYDNGSNEPTPEFFRVPFSTAR